ESPSTPATQVDPSGAVLASAVSTVGHLTVDNLRFTADDAVVRASTAQAAIAGVELPILTYLWLTVLYAVFILFPWVLFLLFLFKKRDSRVDQIVDDLLILDPDGGLLRRAIGEHVDVGKLKNEDPETVRTVNKRLEERAFGDFEYLLSLAVLSVINAVGWY